MIDICTVVFRDELAALRLQAQSIQFFANNIGIRNIYVVTNDEDWLINDIDPEWWGDLKSHVLVIPRTTFSAQWVEDGWLSQQLWKMLVASISYNVWTMALDAKTILTRPLSLDRLFDSGKPRVGRTPLYPVFQRSQEITEQIFGIKMVEQLGPGGVPFLFHNDTVRFMISDCTVRTRTSFPLWFQGQGMLTEFMLYSGYVQMRYGSLDALYSREQEIYPVNLCHSEVGRTDQKLQEMQGQSVSTVSIHRRAWAAMTEEQRHQYRSLLIDRHLMVAYDL